MVCCKCKYGTELREARIPTLCSSMEEPITLDWIERQDQFDQIPEEDRVKRKRNKSGRNRR